MPRARGRLALGAATAFASGAAAADTQVSTAATAAPSATLTPPATIKVARRFPANDPNGVIVAVDTVDFRTYCVRVLSHEWAPPGAFSDEALRAGALAVKDYAWYWATHPTKLPDVAAWGADVDDTTNYQEYMDWDYGQRYWDAVNSTWGTTMTRDGQIFQSSYYAGVYSGAATDGNHMTQWGSQYWAAQGKDHLDPRLLLSGGAVHRRRRRHDRDERRRGERVRGALDRSRRSAGSCESLDVIGPVQLSPGPYVRGATLKANFTLRNDGAQTGTWAIVTLVARGPGDQERDLGSATDITLKPGAYRLFTGAVKLEPLARLADRRRRPHADPARRRGAVPVHGAAARRRREQRLAGARRRSDAGQRLDQSVAGLSPPGGRCDPVVAALHSDAGLVLEHGGVFVCDDILWSPGMAAARTIIRRSEAPIGVLADGLPLVRRPPSPSRASGRCPAPGAARGRGSGCR